MKLSKKGLELIQSFEGYHTAQADGSCVAYLCPAGVATIGWGCTEGVKLGMRWTREEADAAFVKELAVFEAAVERLVTVPLNQNEFDALVSFAYNCGSGALGKSTLLRKLNAGDREGAALSFAAWNKGGGRVLKGLVRRRAAEAALFREPVAGDAEPAGKVIPDMPQKVDEPAAAPTSSRKWSLLQWLKSLFVAPAVGTAGLVSADSVQQAKPWLDLVKTFLRDYGVTVVVVLCVGGFVIVQVIQKLAELDYQEGRYIPSGEGQ